MKFLQDFSRNFAQVIMEKNEKCVFISTSTVPRLGKRPLICLLLFTCNYVVSVWRGFLWVLGMGYVILLWHSLSLPQNYSGN